MPSTTPPLAQFSGTNAYTNISQNPAGVALTTVNPNETVAGQLGTLLRSDNPLVQNAAQNARAFAAARGAGLSGSLYSDNATRAAYDQMTPIAQFDAARYGDVTNRNQEALNQQNLERMGNDTSVTVAGIGAGASIHNNDTQLAEQRRQYDIGQQNRTQNREWALADQNTAARASARSQTFNTILGTIFSDPAYFRDPQGAIGMMNTYGANIDQLLATLFPEYYSTDQQGNPVGGGP